MGKIDKVDGAPPLDHTPRGLHSEARGSGPSQTKLEHSLGSHAGQRQAIEACSRLPGVGWMAGGDVVGLPSQARIVPFPASGSAVRSVAETANQHPPLSQASRRTPKTYRVA